MDDLVRVTRLPPARRGGIKIDWNTVLREARMHPDEWIMIPESVHKSMAANIRRGQYKKVDPTEFMITQRKAYDTDQADRVYLYIKVRP